jgi:hypothetical protein
MIIRNAAKCAKCRDVIQSTHNHDFVSCNCGAIAVDGGNSYLRAVGDQKDFIPLYVLTDTQFIPESVQLENSEVILAAHHSSTCVGKQCALHNRTDHQMRGWRQSIDMIGSTFVITRICPHDIEHTDPDDFFVYDVSWCGECSPRFKQVVFP